MARRPPAAALLVLNDVLEPAVPRRELERLLDEAGERQPGILLGERPLGGGDDLLERVLEHGIDEVLTRGEVPVHGADADTGLARDLAHRDVEPVAGEERAGGGDEPGAVPLGVDALGDGHRPTVAKAERVIRFAGGLFV